MNINYYKGKVLAKSGSDDEEFRFEDFTNIETLKIILGRIDTCEVMISQDGIAFLNDYYLLEDLARLLVRHGWYAKEKDMEQVLTFLKGIDTNAIIY